MEKFKDKYRIQSTRMPGWDYSRGGKYYVTICTRNRVCYFGDVINGEMRLNEIGKIVNDFWLKIPEHFEDTYLDEHIVMPNHIHGIVVMKRSHLTNDGNVTNENVGNDRIDRNVQDVRNVRDVRDFRNVETPKLGVSTSQTSQHTSRHTMPIIPINTAKTTIPNWKPGSLGVIINQFKRICTITIKGHDDFFAWQPRFYDEIIRNDERLVQIRTYIKNNPKKWKEDEHYK